MASPTHKAAGRVFNMIAIRRLSRTEDCWLPTAAPPGAYCPSLFFATFHYLSTGYAQDSQRDADYGVPYVTGSAT